MSPRFLEIHELVMEVLSSKPRSSSIDRLERLLCDSAEARRVYIQYMHETVGLHVNAMPKSASDTVARIDMRGAGVFRGHYAAWLGLAAAVLIAAVTIGIGVLSRDDKPIESPRADVPVATLVWAEAPIESEERLLTGQTLRAQTIRTQAGTTEFISTSQVRILVQGRSEIALTGAMSANLNEGSATFDCPPKAKGYSVYLPRGIRVVDLGTSFKVDIEPSGAMSVRVIDGSVRVESPGGHGQSANALEITEGMIWTFSDAGVASTTHADLPIAPRSIVSTGTDGNLGVGYALTNLHNPELEDELDVSESIHDATVLADSLWVTPSLVEGDSPHSITIDLGQDYDLGSLLLWNYNPRDPFARTNGVARFHITTATESQGEEGLLAYDPEAATPYVARIATSSDAEAAQVFELSDIRARYVRLHLLANHGGDRIGLNELRLVGHEATVVPTSEEQAPAESKSRHRPNTDNQETPAGDVVSPDR